jgi:hypothetical protein
MIWLAQFALLVLLGSGPTSQGTPPAPAPLALPSPLPAPSPSPSATAPGSPSAQPPASATQPPASGTEPPAAATPPPAVPTPPPTATPAPAPTFAYRFVPKAQASPDPSAPQIIEVDLNSRVLHGTIAIRVLTNAVVTKVENHTNGRADVIPQTGPGEFIAVSKLPNIPFFARGMGYSLEFVAFAADGTKTSVKVPVKLG